MGYVLEATYRHGQHVSVLRSEEDVDHFIDELIGADRYYTAATVYAVDEVTGADPDHELVIGVDPQTGLGVLRYSGEGTWWSRGEQTNPAGVQVVYFGTGEDFPADSEVPLATVRHAVKQLLTTGGQRPRDVDWREWDRSTGLDRAV